jgi:hypothetical protein
MSVKNVTRAYLTCDSCGIERMALAADATMARIEAAREGWNFIKYTRWANGDRRSPRSWDACPACELPPTPEAAKEIRDRKEQS